MAQAALRHIIMGLATSGLLMGCVQGAGPGGSTEGTAATAAPGAARLRAGAPRDIEAPEVFQVTDSALWDGRPSLGGIWVASSDVNDPERVVMFNPATGKSVQGALFRRERDNPGPPLQISSDAAEALGILAGQPVEIRVTALRREEPQSEPEAPADAAAAPVAAPVAEGAEPTTDGDADASATAAAATAALAATGVAASGAEAAADTAVAAAETVAETGAEAGLEAGAEAAVAEPPKRKTWKERRAEAKAAREAKKAAADAAKAAEAAAEAAPDGAEVPATTEAAGVAVIETQPLDARASEAAAAEPEAEAMAEPPKTRRQIRDEEAAAAAKAQAAAAAEAEAAAPEANAPEGAGRLIQVASFSKETNATRAVEALAKIGISAQTRKSEIEGKAVWGVVATGDDALLKSIKDAGFADAFFLQ